MKFFTKEVKIGLTALLAIIVIYSGIIFLKGLQLFSNNTYYYVEMDNASGLTPGGEVLASGVKIGLVKTVSFEPEDQSILVQIDVDPDFKIPVGTYASISKEMLGAPKMNLVLAQNTGKYLNSGDKMKAEASHDLMSSAADMIPQIQALIPKLDSILAGVNALANDPSLTESLHNLEYVTNNLKTTTDGVNGLLSKDLPKLMASANNICVNLEGTTSKLNQIDIVSIADNAQGTLKNVNGITAKLNSSLQRKDNSLGMLLNDNSFALHLDSTAMNASRLLEDLRNNPKRYVHFSLFGRKN